MVITSIPKYAVGFVALGLCAGIQAAPLLSDGFEGVAGAGTFTGSDHDPSPAIWQTVTEGTGNDVVVYNDAVGAPIHSGAQALRMQKTSSNSSIQGAFAAKTSVQQSLWVYLPVRDKDIRTLNITLRDSAGSFTAVNLAFNTSGLGYFTNPASPVFNTVVASNNLVFDQWVELSVVANTDSDKFTLSYNATNYDGGGAGYAFFQNTANIGVSYISFSGSTNTVAYMDDIVITDAAAVPEPAALGLVVSGMALLYALRRTGE